MALAPCRTIQLQDPRWRSAFDLRIMTQNHARRIPKRLLCIVVMTLASCRSGSEPLSPTPAPANVEGCYSLILGRWSGPRTSPDPPSSITLLDSVGSVLLEREKLLARPNPISAPMPFDMAWWARLDAEHLDIVFTDGGIIGIRMHLVWGWGDASWRGTAEAFTDVRPTVQAVSTIRLDKRPCA